LTISDAFLLVPGLPGLSWWQLPTVLTGPPHQ